MIVVHEVPSHIQREFGRLKERCVFCRTPTRHWTTDARHAVCPTCAETHSPGDLATPPDIITYTAHLTTAQRKFLAGYLPDILHGDNADLAHANRAEFVRRVAAMDFDDGSRSPRGTERVARSLHKAGLLSKLDSHPGADGGRHIYLIFSKAGAHTLFEINAKGA